MASIIEGKRVMGSSRGKGGGGWGLGQGGIGDYLGLSMLSRMFGFYQVNVCDAEDDTFYCNFSRIFQMFIQVAVVLAIFYLVYVYFIKGWGGGKMMGGKRRGGRRSAFKQ
jgi:hypothetical protein